MELEPYARNEKLSSSGNKGNTGVRKNTALNRIPALLMQPESRRRANEISILTEWHNFSLIFI